MTIIDIFYHIFLKYGKIKINLTFMRKFLGIKGVRVYFTALLVLGSVFLTAYSYLAYQALGQESAFNRPVFNSPDETSNYFFTKLFAEHQTLKFQDPANAIAQGLVSPRSMRVINGFTAPASFLGLPFIYGLLAKITGSHFIVFFTPILAIIGIIFFYLLGKDLFNKRTALIASSLAFILPAFWYYAGKGMMANIAFMSFFIITLYFLNQSLSNGALWAYLSFGLFLALTLMIRTSEVVWLAPLLLLIFIFNFKKIVWWHLFFAILFFILIFSPILFFNQQIYGSIFSVGYSLNLTGDKTGFLPQSLSLMGSIFLPFGFHPRAALTHLFDYTVSLFPLWTAVMAAGWLGFFIRSVYLLFKKRSKAEPLYFLLFTLTAAYLVIFYGSWTFNDNPDPEAITIGTSYARYWLPLYLFSLPPLAVILDKFLGRFKTALPVFCIFLFSALFLTSYQLVMLDSQEGLVKVNENVLVYQQIANETAKVTESNAVIIAGKMDKAFFPLRRVIFQLNVSADYVKIKELLTTGYPVYLFHFKLKDEELDFLSRKDFSAFNLKLDKSVVDFSNQSLYPIKLIP